MPPHINILFRARPALEWIPYPSKSSGRNYSGVFDTNKDLINLFEKTKPPKEQVENSKYNLKLKSLIENIEKNKILNREKLKECKFNYNSW